MSSTPNPILLAALVALCVALDATMPARAQLPAARASAATDSLAAAPDSPPAIPDSAAVALPDSSAAPPTAPAPPAARPETSTPDAPWIDGTALTEIRPETLEDVVEWIPGASVRVAGDTGMPAFVSLGPVGSTAPEIWMDGIPTRSPGDLDPGLWDRSAIAVERAGDFTAGALGSPGDPGWWLQSHDPELGRVVARSRFSSTADESYHRGISATTPASGRTLRLDFEEWKTEEGILYSLAPGVTSRSDRGRSKMRRFRIGGDIDTEAGRVRMFFGRGRRFYRGSVLSALDRERWTGELSLALDRRGTAEELQARAWHLDFRDDDRILRQQIDASRTGLSLERRASKGGWSAGTTVERWSARYAPDDTTVVGPVTAVVARARAGWSADPTSKVRPWVGIDGAWADHLESETEMGARAGADLRARGITVRLSGERALRVPTLAETAGRFGFETVEPLVDTFSYDGRSWSWQGNEALGIERQERVGLHLRKDGRRLALQVGLDHWRLREGVGWTPGPSDELDEAHVTSRVELDVNTMSASGNLAIGLGSTSVRVTAHGQRVLGSLESEAGRGAGWPQWHVRARLLADRRFFSVHNRLGIELDTAGLGPRFDDAVGAFSALELPTRWRIDGRVLLSIRDAAMSVGYDNLLDTEIDEVLGTFRRGRQLRWQLDWTFYN